MRRFIHRSPSQAPPTIKGTAMPMARSVGIASKPFSAQGAERRRRVRGRFGALLLLLLLLLRPGVLAGCARAGRSIRLTGEREISSSLSSSHWASVLLASGIARRARKRRWLADDGESDIFAVSYWSDGQVHPAGDAHRLRHACF
jgi:hypothetical protein